MREIVFESEQEMEVSNAKEYFMLPLSSYPAHLLGLDSSENRLN